ncbi:MAG: hypothetical protein ACWGON_11905, partial [Gemmatimonadota bacterium]
MTDEHNLSMQGSTVASERALSTVHGRISGLAASLWLGSVAVGVVGFVLTLGTDPQRAWISVWSNFLFWTALAQAGVIFGAVLVVAKGHWGKPFRRVAEATGAFLPISLLVFLGMYFGASEIFPWMKPGFEGHINRTWLTHDGVFVRNGILLAILFAASWWFLRVSLRPDSRLIAGKQTGWRRKLLENIGRGWKGDEEEAERSRRTLSWLSPVLIGLWVIVFSFLSFDLTMSLMPSFLS